MFEKLFRMKNEVTTRDDPWSLANPESWLVEALGSRTAAGNLAENISSVQRCLSVRANTISKLPLQVFQRTKEGHQRIRDPAVTTLLEERPNPTTTPSQMKKMISIDIDCWGNSFILIDGSRKQLRRMEPWRVTVDTLTDRTYQYNYSDPVTGTRTTYNYMQVLHFKEYGYGNKLGRSKIENAREVITNDAGAKDLENRYYTRGTLGNAILTSPVDVPLEAKQKIRDEWEKMNAGSENAFRIPVVDRGLEYKQISMSFADAQFLSMRKFSVEEIGRFFNVPPHKLGLMDGAKFNNVQSQNDDFIGNEIQPLLTDIEEEFDYKYFFAKERRDGFYTKFNMEAALRSDTLTRSRYYETMEHVGAININEIRAKEDMNGIGELGDIYWGNLNYVPLEIMKDYQLSKGGTDASKITQSENKQ